MIPTVYTKSCDCQGASSGPRVTLESYEDEPTKGYRVRVSLVRMACDVCDAPWALQAEGVQ